MALDLSQDNRRGKVFCALPDDTLGLVRFEGTDAINDLFEYTVDAVTTGDPINFDDLLGTHMTVCIESGAEDVFFDGLVTECQSTGKHHGGLQYRFTLRPWLWLASHRRDQRIYHQKTVLEIVSDVLSRYETELADETSGSYDALEYTVQYGETDLNFACRLLERYGISYSFAHEKGKHILRLSDMNDQFSDLGERAFIAATDAYNAEEHFHSFGAERQVATAGVSVGGYNFTKPNGKMDHDRAASTSHAAGDISSYDFPGRHLDASGAQRETDIRLRQERFPDGHFYAQGHVETLKSGMQVTLTGSHPEDLDGRDYICIRAHHVFVGQTFASRADPDQREFFKGDYEFVETTTDVVSERRTPDMRMPGPQTAVVVGDSDEIDVDEHGRIFVQFHWDVPGENSMRCRVAQMWAGNKWGTMFIPRIGMEVVVDFIEGDPDQPLVVGCVYNGDNEPPYPLPDKKNISGIKSDSTVGGGGYNEYVFDDTKGEELIRQHAQKDMLTKILNDETREVDNDRTTTIKNDDTRTVDNNEAHTIKKDSSWHIKGARDTKVDKTEDLKVKGKTTVKCDSDILIESKTKITLKVGQSTIVMDPMSVTIKSSLELKQESLSVEIKGKAMLKTQGGAMAEHKGGMMTIQGGLVKIN